MRKLKNMPVPLAVIIMVLLMFAGLVAGNWKALDAASAPLEKAFTAVEELLPERAGKAMNLVSLSKRLNPDSKQATTLSLAAGALKTSHTPSDAFGNDAALVHAADAVVGELRTVINAMQSADDRALETRNLNAATDELAHTENLLTRATRTYNDQATEATAMFSRLPTQWVLYLFGVAPQTYPAALQTL